MCTVGSRTVDHDESKVFTGFVAGISKEDCADLSFSKKVVGPFETACGGLRVILCLCKQSVKEWKMQWYRNKHTSNVIMKSMIPVCLATHRRVTCLRLAASDVALHQMRAT